MHCTLNRIQSDISAISDRRKASLPLKHLEHHNDTTLEDCIEPPVIFPNIHDRHTPLTFLTLESDGNWKIVTVPVQCPDNNSNPTCGSQYTGQKSRWSHGRSQPRRKAIRNSKLLPDNKVDGTVRTSTSKRGTKKGKQGEKLILNRGSAEISPLPSHQNDIQGNCNGDRDLAGAIFSTSDHSITEKFPVVGPVNPLKTNDLRFSDCPSSESDIALVSLDGGEGPQIDSSAFDRGTIEIRHKELPNSDPGQRKLNDVIDSTDRCKEMGRGDNQNAAKNSYRIKAAVNSPSAPRLCAFGNSLSHTTGKENSQPVWQKVQTKLKKERSSVKVSRKILEKNEVPSSEDKRHIPVKVSGKLKRKQYPGSRQESNRYSGKGSSSNKSSNSNIADIPVISPSGNPRDRLKATDAESLIPEPVHDSHACHDGLQLNGKSSNSTADSDNKCTEDWNSSLRESWVNLSITSSAVCLPHLLASRVAWSDKEDTITESCKQKSTCGSAAQKWVPIGTKTLASAGSSSNSYISVGHSHTEARQELIPIVNSENNVSLSTSEVESDVSPHEKGHTEPMENHNIVEEQNLRVDSDISLPGKLGRFPTDLDRIAVAVDHAHMAQLASEAVQMATGGPIAEFERLLHLSSPVLCISHSISSCKMCSRNHSSCLCVHERPDIPLGCLWEWYRKHGYVGLEVRGKDYNNSKRLGMDQFSFRAYFVPYLSAVQLFRTGKKQPRKSEEPNVHKTCENSTVNHLPIFPLLVPRASKDEIASQTAESDESHETEVIFEYFELEQPQQRQPLYEKIRELVRGDGASQDKAYGDPSKLHSISLQDLDPRSWYSVAWYPIYRIPDGNFRAAFLTYHSFGHLVCRNGVEDSVVSPVVGLQSYKAQGECWLQLTPSVMSQTSQIPSLDPSKILKERLRTLEEAASSMSRATVSKGGDISSVNNHPDYEFFLSRRQYY